MLPFIGEPHALNFFGSDRTAIQLGKYALIDDVFTDLVRDANGRATMKLMYNGKELHVMLGPKYKTVLLWSTALNAGGGGPAAPRARVERAAAVPAERVVRRRAQQTRHPGRIRLIQRTA